MNVQSVKAACAELRTKRVFWVFDTFAKTVLVTVSLTQHTTLGSQVCVALRKKRILRSLKLTFSLLCGIGVGLAAEATEPNPETARKIYNLVRSISSHHLKSTTWTIGGEGCTIECDESHIFKRKYNRGQF